MNSNMVECPVCGKEYKNLATHWHHSPSHRPDLTQKQIEITTGLLMGDGCADKCSRNSRVKCAMISPNYLEYINDIFGCLATGVSLRETAAESAKNNRDTGFRPDAKEENYSDVYKWQTRTHPKFNEFREWYSSGEKVWPKDIELTPTVLKHWYVGDGYYSNKQGNDRIEIAMSNETENTKKVSQYFTDVGLPQPSNYGISTRKSGDKTCDAQWDVEDSHILWEYMGEPLPDFKYKWPKEYR
jgi:hypothetical protein